MKKKQIFEVGATIYVDGHEIMLTQIRIDKTSDGVSVMLLGVDPMSYTKAEMESEAKKDFRAKQFELIKAAKKSLG